MLGQMHSVESTVEGVEYYGACIGNGAVEIEYCYFLHNADIRL